MSKNLILNIFTLLIIAGLAGSTTYFYLKNHEKTTLKGFTSDESPFNHTVPINSTPKTTTPDPKPQTPDSSTAGTKPASSSNRPSNPAETYTVGPGETLSGISQKLNMNWTRLTEINNMTNGDSIKEGQVLIVPTYDEKNKKLFAQFQTDVQKATQLQEQAAKLPTSPYLDPAATAKTDSTGIYGLAATDTFTFVSQNELEGTAIVNATHLDKQYQINLVQPVKKGKDGIWAISQIIPTN